MRVIVVMETNRRVVCLAKVEQFVETALEQLPVHQQKVHLVPCLDDLKSKLAFIVEALLSKKLAILWSAPRQRVQPHHLQGLSQGQMFG